MPRVNHPTIPSISYEVLPSQLASWVANGWVYPDAPAEAPVSVSDETEDDVPVDEPALTVEPHKPRSRRRK